MDIDVPTVSAEPVPKTASLGIPKAAPKTVPKPSSLAAPKPSPLDFSELLLYSDDRQEDTNRHSYVKLDEDIVKRSCDKAVFKYYSV
ncbi:hypothetical protein G5714_017949 [Onychostoma macrolepis]|uniref:Uncharacterized protein n=1 Tax=Onychostoma macrolepis TaxID=369639 RepID=A0A7J6C2K9_9TELE|nr:hypothetical protein G5714_017949 [Onychostoma macrolepis]